MTENRILSPQPPLLKPIISVMPPPEVTLQIPQQKTKRNLNLKIGDVVFFKSYLTEDFKGVVSGDGIASNKLECVQSNAKLPISQPSRASTTSVKSKNANLMFQKCLFKIVNGKKYYYQEQLGYKKKEPKNKQPGDQEKQKALDEIEENKRMFRVLNGTNITYGQEIQLVHFYSNCTLTLNHQILAKQNCCRELSLEEHAGSSSNFKIESVNKSKQIGEPVLYGDQIILKNSYTSQWALGIERPLEFLTDSFEVNASEKPAELKLCGYIDHKTDDEHRITQTKGKYLESGDIVYIHNRAFGGFLALQGTQLLTDKLDPRSVLFKDYETSTFKEQKQLHFDIDILKESATLEGLYKFYIETSPDYESNLNTLWQIQTANSLNFEKCTYNNVYLIKHVSTGCFMYIKDDEISLTYDGHLEDCKFQLKSKKFGSEEIVLSEALKIQPLIQSNVVLSCTDDMKMKFTKKNQKNNIQQSQFLFKLASNNQAKIANRVSSLQTYLLQFYLFLQDWGFELKNNQIFYEYYKAFNNQKSLYDEILQLFQALENLKDYLTNGGEQQSNEDLVFKQKHLQDNDIIALLFAILIQSHFMVYGSQDPKTVPDKSPQKVAKMKLDPTGHSRNCIQQIYEILQLCVQSNPTSSDYILTLKIKEISILEFLLKQLRFHRADVSSLLKESVRYTDTSNERSTTNLKTWVSQLRMVTEDNVEDQTLFVEILSLMMIDPFESPNRQCQDLCRKLLFKKNSANAFQKSLIVCGIIADQLVNEMPYVQFNPQLQKDNQWQGEDSFALCNPIYVKLYSQYMEKVSKTEGRFKSNRMINVISIEFLSIQALRKYKLVRADEAKKTYTIFQKYEDFVINVFNLYSSICKGRNQKSINILKQQCKIDINYLHVCLNHLRNQQNELRIEKAILNLYVNLVMDVDPLTLISRFDNKTFLEDDIKTLQFDSHSGSIFFENNISKQIKESKEYQEFITLTIKKADTLQEHQHLKKYSERLVDQVNNDTFLRFYIDMFISDGEYPQHFVVPEMQENLEFLKSNIKKPQLLNYDYATIAKYQLEFFLSILVLVRNSVDLGYNRLETNKQIFKIIPNILITAIIGNSNKQVSSFKNEMHFHDNLQELRRSLKLIDIMDEYFERDVHSQRSNLHGSMANKCKKTWIFEFLMWTTSLCNDKLLTMKIYLEAIQLLRVLQSLKMNLQIIGFLGSANNNQSCLTDYQAGFESQEEISPASHNRMHSRHIMDIYEEEGSIDLNSLLFSVLYNLKGRNKLNEELIKAIIQGFNQPAISCDEIKEVEIIDDAIELNYFSIVNGNSHINPWISPREAILDSRKALKYIHLKKVQKSNSDAEAFLNIKLYVQQVIDLINESIKENHMQQVQNIIRNAGIHNILKMFLINPQDINTSEEIVQFYKNLLTFFKLFSHKNPTNIKELENINHLLLNIILLKQDKATNQMYVPLKVTSLILSILQGTNLSHELLIKQLFKIIHRIAIQLKEYSILFSRIQFEEDLIITPQKEKSIANETQVIYISSARQYLKILKFLTHTSQPPQKIIFSNQHLILSMILEDNFLKFLLDPINFFEHILMPESMNKPKDQDPTLKYQEIQLHCAIVELVTSCVRYNRLAIQEIQRVLLYDQLKTVLLHEQSIYLVKRVYLQCVFELYINRVFEEGQVNEVIDNDEVRDILSRIIIPELEQKQICRNLEGLAKLREDPAKQVKTFPAALRESIRLQKDTYFANNKSMGTEIKQYNQSLRDISEFWKYIRKNGIIHFLVYTYDEMKDRINFENLEDNNLSDEFAIIKQSVQKIKDIFNILERDFRMKKEDLDLDIYRELITSIEEIIPQRKITKFGKNFRIGFQGSNLQFDQFDTLKEDQNGEKKLQEQEVVLRVEDQFQRNMKIYLVRHNVTITELCDFIQEMQYRKYKQINTDIYKIFVQIVNINKPYIKLEEIKLVQQNQVAQMLLKEQVTIAKGNPGWEPFKIVVRDMFERKRMVEFNQEKHHIQAERKLDIQKVNFRDTVSSWVKYQLTRRIPSKQLEEQLINEPWYLLQSDNQIQILLNAQQRHHTQELSPFKIGEFLLKCQDIFQGYLVYLIKFCRIFLRQLQPTEDEIDMLSEVNDEQSEQYKQVDTKLALFKEYQIQIANAKIDIMALQILADSNHDLGVQIETITLLVNLLDLGNNKVQERIFKLFQDDFEIKNNFIQFIRNYFLTDNKLKLEEMRAESQTPWHELTIKLLKLLQCLCENVHLEFQRFLIIQNEDDQYNSNINIVSEVSNLLADILEHSLELPKKHRIIRQAIESLIEFTTGSDENKRQLQKNTRLFTLLNVLISRENHPNDLFQEVQYENIVGDTLEQRKLTYETLESYIKLLLSMTQGNADEAQLRFICENVFITELLIIANQIYQYRIAPKKTELSLDLICTETGTHQHCFNYHCYAGFRTDDDNLLIETGFNIFHVCLKLAELFSDRPELQIFKFDEEQQESDDDDNEIIDEEAKHQLHKKSQIMPAQKYEQVPLEESLDNNNDNFYNKSMRQIRPQDIKNMAQEVAEDQMLEMSRKDPFFKYYRDYTGRIEIANQSGIIEKVYFRKPYLSQYLTPNIKHHIIYQSNRESDEDRMMSLIENSEFYTTQMAHNQRMVVFRLFKYGAKYWRTLKDISFLLCLLIVLLLIFMHDTVINSKLGSEYSVEDNTTTTAGEVFVSYLNNIITIVQLVLNVIIVVFCALERYPISITYGKGETNAKRVQVLKKEAGIHIRWLTLKYYYIIGFFENLFQPRYVRESCIRQMILIIFFDFDNFYNLVLLGLTAYAFFNPYIYTVLLLDIVKRSEDLQNIIKSITSNGKNLIIFAFLGVIGMIVYAVISFAYFKAEYPTDQFINDEGFIYSVMGTISGLRSGGGIGDVLSVPPTSSEDYWGLYFYDLTFFIIFNILFIQIIFGIILDTFGELRDERQALIKEIEGKCFVCSLARNEIDTKGTKGWYYHIYLEHSVYNMLYYIIYIRKKNITDCNALEKYVKQCVVKDKSTRFFPFQKCLQMPEE